MKLTTTIIILSSLALHMLAATAGHPSPAAGAPAAKDVKDAPAGDAKAKDGKAAPAADAAKDKANAAAKDKADNEGDNGSPSLAHVSAGLCILAGVAAFVT